MTIQETTSPLEVIELNGTSIRCYDNKGNNIDLNTVNSFGEEWTSFHGFSDDEIKKIGDDNYFDILTPDMTGAEKIAIDFGCGSGRWTKYICKKFGAVIAVDPSKAIFSASYLLKDIRGIYLYKASIDSLPFPDNYFDFGFSLGVLHHIPDTLQAMKDCVRKIKPGGHFLVYLYYSLDNRSIFFRLLFRLSDVIRKVVSRLPGKSKRFVCDVLAIIAYMPFIMLCRFCKIVGVPLSLRKKIPLQIYETTSFYIIRNDSLDRFGTPLEQRFSKMEIQRMMDASGLTDIVFSSKESYWHAVGRKK